MKSTFSKKIFLKTLPLTIILLSFTRTANAFTTQSVAISSAIINIII